MNLSVCIITKNECVKLKECLSRLVPYGFEIVVVDTGSTDGTLDMVLQYTSSLYEFPWIDDFAAAKNYAVKKAKNDMVMVVDSDEYLIRGDISEFLDRMKKNTDMIGRIRRVEKYVNNHGEYIESIDDTNRVFDRRKFHFAGRIHEQIVCGSIFDEVDKNAHVSGLSYGYDTYDTGLIFDHDGYNGTSEERKRKAARNAALLLKEANEHPDDPYTYYQLGKSYYMADDVQKAVEYFDKVATYNLDTRLEWVLDMIVTYGHALLDAKQVEKAALLESVYDYFCHDADFLFMMGLVYMNNAEFERAVNEFLIATKIGMSRTAGVNSYKAFYNIGVIKECTGKIEEAINYYRKAGDYEPAKERIKRFSI